MRGLGCSDVEPLTSPVTAFLYFLCKGMILVLFAVIGLN
jgi:hypothetical protein